MRRFPALRCGIGLGCALFAAAVGNVAPVQERQSARGGAGLQLLGFVRAPDNAFLVVNGIRIRRSITRKDGVASAWVDIGRRTLRKRDLSNAPGSVCFELEAEDGSRFPVSAYPAQGNFGTNVACLLFLPGSGGKFVNPHLVAEIDGKQVARWPLTDYPTDRRVIPESEPSKTVIDNVLGLTIKADADVRVYEKFGNRYTGWVNFGIDVQGDFNATREYWVYHSITESTWRKEASGRGHGSLFTEPRNTGIGTATEYAAYADRVRVEGSVEIFEVYEEPAVFKNLTILRDAATGALVVSNGMEQSLVLTTGVRIVMPQFKENISYDQPLGVRRPMLNLKFHVYFPDGNSNLFLPLALDSLGFTDDVQLKLGKVLANSIWHGAGGGLGPKRWQLIMRVDPTTVSAGTTFDLSLGIKHVVPVASEPFQLLVPLERKQ